MGVSNNNIYSPNAAEALLVPIQVPMGGNDSAGTGEQGKNNNERGHDGVGARKHC